MPLRARSGKPSEAPAGSSSAIRYLVAAATSAAAAATATARHAGIHHRVRREGGGAGSYGGEIGDHTPRVGRTALGTLSGVVRSAHRTHEVEAILTACALVLVEGHLYPTSRSGNLMAGVLYSLSRPEGNSTIGRQRAPGSYPALRF